MPLLPLLNHSTVCVCVCSQVSWVRRKSGDANLDLLTVGKHTYSGDPRYSSEFQYPDNWRLRLEAAAKADEGTYECQISTHPPRIIQKNVFVNGEWASDSNRQRFGHSKANTHKKTHVKYQFDFTEVFVDFNSLVIRWALLVELHFPTSRTQFNSTLGRTTRGDW